MLNRRRMKVKAFARNVFNNREQVPLMPTKWCHLALTMGLWRVKSVTSRQKCMCPYQLRKRWIFVPIIDSMIIWCSSDCICWLCLSRISSLLPNETPLGGYFIIATMWIFWPTESAVSSHAPVLLMLGVSPWGALVTCSLAYDGCFITCGWSAWWEVFLSSQHQTINARLVQPCCW